MEVGQIKVLEGLINDPELLVLVKTQFVVNSFVRKGINLFFKQFEQWKG